MKENTARIDCRINTREGEEYVERYGDHSSTVEDLISSISNSYIVQMAPPATLARSQVKTVIFSPEAFPLKAAIANRPSAVPTALYGLVPTPTVSHQDHSLVAIRCRQDIQYQQARRARSQSPARSCFMQLVEPRYRARSGPFNQREPSDTCQFCHNSHLGPFSQTRRTSRIFSRNLADGIQSLTLEDDPDKMDWTYD